MLKISQVQCKVNNIHQAVTAFERHGFHVDWGTTPEKSSNAFIWFPQGPCIELFQMSAILKYAAPLVRLFGGREMKDRWMSWYHSPEGLTDFALEAEDEHMAKPDQFEQVCAYVKSLGIDISRIVNSKRTRPDGLKVRYSFCATMPKTLPFLVSAYDPLQHPVQIVHQNGASEISWVRLGVKPGQENNIRNLVGNDSRLIMVPAEQTKIQSIGLAGLNIPLEPELLHNACCENANSI